MYKRVVAFVLILLQLPFFHKPFPSGVQSAKALGGTNQPLLAISSPLTVSPVNPRYFSDSSGNIVYLTGSHTWCNFMDCDDTNPISATFNYNAYLDFLVSKNHNFFRLWRAENARGGEAGDNFWFNPMPYQRSTTCCAFDGGNKFNLTQFNQAYFDRMRSRIIAARDRGIYVSVMLFDGWSVESKISNHFPWKGHPYNIVNNISNVDGDSNNDNQGGETHTLAISQITSLQEAYVRKVIDTVNDLDNVLYEISNESPSNSQVWQYHMINYIKTYEASKPKKHPVGMTWEWPGGNNNDYYNSPADWISLGGGVDLNTYVPPANNGSKVILADTDHLCGICGNRKWVWKSFTRGENPIFMDIYDNATSGRGMPFSNPSEAEIRTNMGYTRSYATRMNLAGMTPQPALCSTGFCLAKATASNAEFLAYLPNAGSININLSAVSGNLSVEWFNPANGGTTIANPVNGGAIRTLTAPFGGDAVVYLKSGPAHDNFASAQVIASIPYSHSIDTRATNTDGDGPSVPGTCDGSSLRKGIKNVWYKFSSPAPTTVFFDTLGSDYDTYLAIWTGSNINNLTLVACDNNDGASAQSRVPINIQAGITYYIEIAQYNGTLPNGPASTPTGGSLALHMTSFADVPGNYWAWRYIEGFYRQGITTGCLTSPPQYCPEREVTRAEMAVFLLRARHGAAYQPNPGQTNIFADVPVAGKEWMEPWIEQFYLEGITVGCATDPLRYCPEREVTRAEMAVFLLRAKYGAGFQPHPSQTGMFDDLPVAGKEWMQPWIEQFYLEGITVGCVQSPLRYCPERNVTRAEMAVFIDRAFGIPLLP